MLGEIIFIIFILLAPLLGFVFIALFGRFFGTNGSFIISVFSLLFPLFILSWFIFKLTSRCSSELFIFEWFGSYMPVNYGIFLDPLSLEMSTLVVFITTLVVIYSNGYLNNDPHLIRFFSYLLLFAFFMLLLVLSNNLVLLFVGWEGVGLASFLLINFWFSRLEANRSAIKAIIFNKVGDVFFVAGLVYTFLLFKTTDFSVIFSVVTLTNNMNTFDLEIIGFLFFLGAMAKSAQIGLHAWLADAMEGPTPVSALLHSATMVAAGVFLLIRLSPLYLNCSYVLVFISIVGSLTALFGGTVALFQFDLKKVIAYSTCSQLGLMVCAFGTLNIVGSLFHLTTHAFFKSLLFLTAGSVIHAFSDEQDMRRMGGSFEFIPFTASSMVIGFLGLTGFPFLSGFFSKEFIILSSLNGISFIDKFVFISVIIASMCTVFYSIRVVFLVFYSQYRGFFSNIKSMNDSNVYMVFSMFILSLMTIFFGFYVEDIFVGIGSWIWNNSLGTIDTFALVEQESISVLLRLFLVFLPMIGLIIFLIFYERFKVKLLFAYVFMYDKWFFSSIYRYIVDYFFKLSYDIFIKLVDRGLLERIQSQIILALYEITEKVFKVFSGFSDIFDYLIIFFGGLFFTLLVLTGWCKLNFLFFLIFILFLDVWGRGGNKM